MNINDLTFEVYANRWLCKREYRVNKTSQGWYLKHIAINGDCTPDGNPYFYTNFDQDYITYPNQFGDFLEWLWNAINNNEIDRENAQNKLQELANWVSECEKCQPKWNGWNV